MMLLVLVLTGEAGMALFVMRDLERSHTTVQKMYNGSVQGLLRIGDMQYEAQETRRSTLYALTTNDGNLQVAYADQSHAADRGVTEGIERYLAEARSQDETRVGQQLSKDWTDYLTVRDEVLGLILEGSPKEAVRLDLNLGVSEFDRVRHDLDELKRSYDKQAAQQLATVADLSQSSMTRLTAALVLGLLLGTAAIWVIQKSRMRSAMQLARLQMDFVASVSHELRTPLTAILTAGENIRDRMVVNSDHVVEQSTVITDQAYRLMAIVDQVLQFSATRQKKSAHLPRKLRVNEVIDDALRSSQSVIDEAGFAVETRIDPDLPAIVADLPLLSQCLQNLIVNAVKYRRDKRWIGIAARMDRQENEILVSIQDQGIGIQAAELKRIFEPFYRSPQVIGARIRGTGLGLSIAQRSAEVFGGRLTVLSEVGIGSVFTVHLPLREDIRLKASSPESAVGGAQA